MNSLESDKAFTGSVPRIYETYLVPLLFAPYAADVVRRLAPKKPRRILEIAAGTGAVTRAMAAGLPDADITATDLNQAMLDHASSAGVDRPVEWKVADAMELPFPDRAFDAVVCQFGVMFFPDKAKAFAEARRVLAPGGTYIFNVWDRIEENEFADTITTSLASLFPEDPPQFLPRTPYGHFDQSVLQDGLSAGGFSRPAEADTVTFRSRAESARIPAVAYCQGTPLRNEIEARGAVRLEEATDVAAEAIARQFGRGAVDGKIQAHVFTVDG